MSADDKSLEAAQLAAFVPLSESLRKELEDDEKAVVGDVTGIEGDTLAAAIDRGLKTSFLPKSV